jgi:hypothetical protein
MNYQHTSSTMSPWKNHAWSTLKVVGWLVVYGVVAVLITALLMFLFPRGYLGLVDDASIYLREIVR